MDSYNNFCILGTKMI